MCDPNFLSCQGAQYDKHFPSVDAEHKSYFALRYNTTFYMDGLPQFTKEREDLFGRPLIEVQLGDVEAEGGIKCFYNSLYNGVYIFLMPGKEGGFRVFWQDFQATKVWKFNINHFKRACSLPYSKESLGDLRNMLQKRGYLEDEGKDRWRLATGKVGRVQPVDVEEDILNEIARRCKGEEEVEEEKGQKVEGNTDEDKRGAKRKREED